MVRIRCDVQKLLSIVGVSRAQISRDTVPMSADCNGTVASASTVLSTLHNIPPKGTHRSSVTKQQCPIKANLAVGQISPYPSSKQRSSPKPLYDVFLGGSCGNTVWRRDQVIPYLEKRAITYYDPQRSVWNEHMINEESVAKENSSLFLFVLDPATVNATSFLEIAHFAARKAPKLVVVFLGRTEWRDRGHPQDLPDRRRTCDLLDTILTMHDVPVLQSIQEALSYIDEMIIGEKSWSEALWNPFQRLPYMMLKGRRALRQSASHVRTAWRTVTNGVTRWRGTKYLIIGACEMLFVLAVHLFVQSIPLVLLVLPLLALDVLVGVCSLAYWRYKSLTAAKRRAQILEQRAFARSTPVPIPGRAFVPCDIVAQHIPLNCSCKDADEKKHSNSISAQRVCCRRVKYLKVFGCIYRKKTSERLLLDACERSDVWMMRIAVLKTRSYESNGVASPLRWMSTGGYDIFLGCSSTKSADLEWITRMAAPQLHKKGISYCSELMIERHKRLPTLDMTRRILYLIPSCETILSGMVEVAYFLGHTNWSVTLCVPKRAKMFDSSSVCDEEMRRHIERRNECYRMAFCYLRDMAERRHCEVLPIHVSEERNEDCMREKGLAKLGFVQDHTVFTHLDDALQYVISCSKD
ncbi:unnamed protein product [Toxocara canis]|uniref:TIR domain-containing protein n=1 Tax=Toxocara canis TaxID=6265 RepID=A0A183V3F9_TOXCA|nr:unnamed protein product [Toxocara canis]